MNEIFSAIMQKEEEYQKSLEEYVRSGQYFIEARSWYSFKYLRPITERSIMIICAWAFFVLLLTTFISLILLMPIERKVSYASYGEDILMKSSSIIRANRFSNEALRSINYVLMSYYITKRESYNIENIDKQLNFIKNTSSKKVFEEYKNFVSFSNKLSPIVRYGSFIKRDITINNIKYLSNKKILANFVSRAKEFDQTLLEEIEWQVIAEFDSDELVSKQKVSESFRFIVNNYELKLLKKIK